MDQVKTHNGPVPSIWGKQVKEFPGDCDNELFEYMDLENNSDPETATSNKNMPETATSNQNMKERIPWTSLRPKNKSRIYDIIRENHIRTLAFPWDEPSNEIPCRLYKLASDMTKLVLENELRLKRDIKYMQIRFIPVVPNKMSSIQIQSMFFMIEDQEVLSELKYNLITKLTEGVHAGFVDYYRDDGKRIVTAAAISVIPRTRFSGELILFEVDNGSIITGICPINSVASFYHIGLLRSFINNLSRPLLKNQLELDFLDVLNMTIEWEKKNGLSKVSRRLVFD